MAEGHGKRAGRNITGDQISFKSETLKKMCTHQERKFWPGGGGVKQIAA